MGFLLINAEQHAATLFDGRKRLIKPHLSTKNERILPANVAGVPYVSIFYRVLSPSCG